MIHARVSRRAVLAVGFGFVLIVATFGATRRGAGARRPFFSDGTDFG